jgi:polar amino acid transport system substrate-binding protein
MITPVDSTRRARTDGRRHRVLPAVLVITLGLVAAACGSSDNGGVVQSSSTTGASALFSSLPDAIQKAKQINVGSDISYPPVESFKEGTQTPEGIDIDLGNAIGEKLGVKFNFQNVSFEGIIAGLTAKRFDVIMSAMSDTQKRRDQGLDFVDYFVAGTSIIVQKGNPKGINSPTDFCGTTIGIQKGTTQEEVANATAAQCVKDGKGKLTIQAFEKDPEALQQLKLGRTVADMNDFPVAAFAAAQSPNDFVVVGEQIEAGPYGIAVRKEDSQLRDAIQAGLKAIIADGTYDRILQQHNVSQGALKTAAINGG